MITGKKIENCNIEFKGNTSLEGIIQYQAKIIDFRDKEANYNLNQKQQIVQNQNQQSQCKDNLGQTDGIIKSQNQEEIIAVRKKNKQNKMIQKMMEKKTVKNNQNKGRKDQNNCSLNNSNHRSNNNYKQKKKDKIKGMNKTQQKINRKITKQKSKDKNKRQRKIKDKEIVQTNNRQNNIPDQQEENNIKTIYKMESVTSNSNAKLIEENLNIDRDPELNNKYDQNIPLTEQDEEQYEREHQPIPITSSSLPASLLSMDLFQQDVQTILKKQYFII